MLSCGKSEKFSNSVHTQAGVLSLISMWVVLLNAWVRSVDARPSPQSKIPNFFKKDFYLFIFRAREREGRRERDRERNIDVWEIHQLVASHAPPTWDLAHNPGMYPDWESNWWPFSLQASTQSTEPHQPGPMSNFWVPKDLTTNGLLMTRSHTGNTYFVCSMYYILFSYNIAS